MPTVIIPDKICPHCGGNRWFKRIVKGRGKIYYSYSCITMIIERNKKASKEDKNKWHQNWVNRNLSKVQDYGKKWRKANSKYLKDYGKAYYKANSNTIKATVKKNSKNPAKNLTNGYIREAIYSNLNYVGIKIKATDIPQDLIITKRKSLCLKRTIQLKKSA